MSLCPTSDLYLLNLWYIYLETSPIEAIVCKSEKYVHIILVVFTAKAKSKIIFLAFSNVG